MTNLSLFNQEKWLPLVGYEGYYEISDQGRIKSLSRSHVCKNGRLRKVKERIKQCYLNIDGYPVTTLYKEAVGKAKRVPVAVLEAFCGPRPSCEHVAMHLDNNKTNNFLSNLKWGTNSENVRHSVISNTHYSPNHWANQTGAKHHNSKIIIQKTIDGKELNRFHGSGDASRITGVGRSKIAQNVRGKSKTGGGYVWCYA